MEKGKKMNKILLCCLVYKDEIILVLTLWKIVGKIQSENDLPHDCDLQNPPSS